MNSQFYYEKLSEVYFVVNR